MTTAWLPWLEKPERSARHLLDHDPPIPLTQPQAVHQAIRLHNKGWTWLHVSKVMGEYHGHWRSASSWKTLATATRVPVRRRVMSPAQRAAFERMQAARHGERVGEAA
jgi:hypothetical protein